MCLQKLLEKNIKLSKNSKIKLTSNKNSRPFD